MQYAFAAAGVFFLCKAAFTSHTRDNAWYEEKAKAEREKDVKGLKQTQYSTELKLLMAACEEFLQDTIDRQLFMSFCQSFVEEAGRFGEKGSPVSLQLMQMHVESIKTHGASTGQPELVERIVKHAEAALSQAQGLNT